MKQISEPDFYHILHEISGPAIVFFTKQGCSSCIAWERLLTEYAEKPGAYPVFKLDAEQSMGLVNEYNLFHLPALFLFIQGEFHCELQSEARLAQFQSMLEQAIAAPAMEAP